MSEFSCVVRRPGEFGREELEDFASLVLAGGEVTAKGLAERITNAHALAFLRSGPCLIGVAGLKNPESTYRSKISHGSGVTLSAAEFGLELGWIFALPSARGGKSFRLCSEILAAAGENGVFATTRSGNVPMHKTLAKLGFKRAGKRWSSRKNEDELLLFVRPSSESDEHSKWHIDQA